MVDLILSLENMISDSEKLLIKDKVNSDEITTYKKKSAELFIKIINSNINETVNDLAKRALNFEIKKIKNALFRWIYEQLTTARDDITYNAPYLKKHTDSDYRKRYIFWTKENMKGLIFNLKRIYNKI